MLREDHTSSTPARAHDVFRQPIIRHPDVTTQTLTREGFDEAFELVRPASFTGAARELYYSSQVNIDFNTSQLVFLHYYAKSGRQLHRAPIGPLSLQPQQRLSRNVKGEKLTIL